MNNFDLIGRAFIGVTAGYTAYRLMEEKADELVEDGGMLNAFLIGAGQAGLAITAGIVAAVVVPRKF